MLAKTRRTSDVITLSIEALGMTREACSQPSVSFHSVSGSPVTSTRFGRAHDLEEVRMWIGMIVGLGIQHLEVQEANRSHSVWFQQPSSLLMHLASSGVYHLLTGHSRPPGQV
jgi:hypothetical protein